MTREEAIKGLTSLLEVRRRWDDMQTMKDEIECLDMAIKALEDEAVLDKIRAEIIAEIIEKFENCSICEWFEDYDYEENDISEYRSVGDISDIIEIINKYKEESEDKLDGDPIDIDKAVEHYEGTLEELKDIDLEVDA